MVLLSSKIKVSTTVTIVINNTITIPNCHWNNDIVLLFTRWSRILSWVQVGYYFEGFHWVLFWLLVGTKSLNYIVCYLYIHFFRNNRFHILYTMKFGQFMLHYKRKNLIKKFCENYGMKISSWPFCTCKELSTASIGK